MLYALRFFGHDQVSPGVNVFRLVWAAHGQDSAAGDVIHSIRTDRLRSRVGFATSANQQDHRAKTGSHRWGRPATVHQLAKEGAKMRCAEGNFTKRFAAAAALPGSPPRAVFSAAIRG